MKIIILLLIIIYYIIPIYSIFKSNTNVHSYLVNDTYIPTLSKWNLIDEKDKISLTSYTIQHSQEGPWYVPSYHNKYSYGWNRTIESGYLNSPMACNLRFFGIGLESTLEKYKYGGTGYIRIHFQPQNKGKKFWHGFSKNETEKLHCYYMTNKHYGSEFVDKPKTLAIVVYCPIIMDNEVGPFNFNSIMQPGMFCRAMADNPSEVEIVLRPSNFELQTNHSIYKDTTKDELLVEITTVPLAERKQNIKERNSIDPRPHAVCTVQTFKNSQTGPMLYLFAIFYYRLGWRVIIYDRFGLHREYLDNLIDLPGIDYHPYTIFQITMPSKYNDDYLKKSGSDRKVFYKMEKNWGYKGSEADTADQDADKTHTYDHARLEYVHLDMILYIDSDEFFYCPQASKSLNTQRKYQHHIMGLFSSQGIEEMRFVRIPYSGKAPIGFVNSVENRSNTDFTLSTEECMINSYNNDKNVLDMFNCWSSASSYDNFPKSADFASKCPFHYNHWSCDGMRAGGRDWGDTTPRCRCKVGFEMQNGYEFRPRLKKCHILHINDNKYRFQSSRSKHEQDKGNVYENIPVSALFTEKSDHDHNIIKFKQKDLIKELSSIAQLKFNNN